MSHHQISPATNNRLYDLFDQFFTVFEGSEVAENLLFITGEFVERPPDDISRAVAFEYLHQMNSLAMLLSRARVAMAEHEQQEHQNADAL